MPSSPSQNSESIAHFDPTSFFTSTEQEKPCALVILNCPLVSLPLLELLWRKCEVKLCADGGANRLFDFLGASGRGEVGDERKQLLPTHIHGDLDSLRPDVEAYYAANGVSVTRDPDQYSTDFGKNMKLVCQHFNLEQSSPTSSQSDVQAHSSTTKRDSKIDVVILGTLAGRVDHGLGLLHELLREYERSPSTRLWFVTETNISFILGGGTRSIIQIAAEPEVLGRNVGVIPLYGEAVIGMKGFKWDVERWPTKMGVIVSTSNLAVEEKCEVETDVAVLFTIDRVKFVNTL